MSIYGLKEREEVVIIDGSDWNGKHGLVQAVYPELGFADIFCVQCPTTLYRVFEWNSNCIIKQKKY